jgi:tRNA-dihydrouridine synthase
MGCPDRAVEKQGGGAGMIRNPKAAIAVLYAAREGALDIPVTVKTRLGYNAIDWEWIRLLLEQKLPVLTVHLRTRKEMSEVAAHWELMPEVVRLRNEISPETLIIGNGDVESLEDARAKAKKYGCDGVMIGRGIFGRPWFFAKIRDQRSKIKNLNADEKSPEERLKILLEHTKMFEKTFCGKKRIKSFAVMKKHFKAYVNGWDNAKDLRAKLMETNSYKEVKAIITEYLKNR